jgi:hypothetical protein
MPCSAQILVSLLPPIVVFQPGRPLDAAISSKKFP